MRCRASPSRPGEDALSVTTPYFVRRIPYNEMEGLLLRDYEKLEIGECIEGKHGTVNVGIFRNSEFGEYDMASHVSSKVYAVAKHAGRHLVFTMTNVEATKQSTWTSRGRSRPPGTSQRNAPGKSFETGADRGSGNMPRKQPLTETP
ncbi:hypothetical protein AUQ37_07195 [Candidatus Methanomethylophilus sp. 1R26]|uniref:hypothetical protein n=1 Tax=Candidatus Methanomethylophilus sp. 1R26 TaxID=1769296 RepID=UPI000735E060|nr:hypothetical protein [Candidatus Methanomethylophilus sp. 1R26]KUE73826.1 hypothetical protein AUQ37_07195 [Candidatus Methanomethylophilus sp. 1R26]